MYIPQAHACMQLSCSHRSGFLYHTACSCLVPRPLDQTYPLESCLHGEVLAILSCIGICNSSKN